MPNKASQSSKNKSNASASSQKKEKKSPSKKKQKTTEPTLSRGTRKHIEEVANAIPHLIAKQMMEEGYSKSYSHENDDNESIQSSGGNERPYLPPPTPGDPHRGRKMFIIWTSVLGCMVIIIGSWIFHMRAMWYDMSRMPENEQSLTQQIQKDFAAVVDTFEKIPNPLAASATSTSSTVQNTPTSTPSSTPQTIEQLLIEQLTAYSASSTVTTTPSTTP